MTEILALYACLMKTCIHYGAVSCDHEDRCEINCKQYAPPKPYLSMNAVDESCVLIWEMPATSPTSCNTCNCEDDNSLCYCTALHCTDGEIAD